MAKIVPNETNVIALLLLQMNSVNRGWNGSKKKMVIVADFTRGELMNVKNK
jgi:hypothetical protein